MDRRRGFGEPPPFDDTFTPGARRSGWDWAMVGTLFALGVLGMPGATLGDKVRRACQCLLWEIAAAVIIFLGLAFTWRILVGALGAF